jgi:putative sterol carrier protein
MDWRMIVAQFPSKAWVQALSDKLNSDEKYAKIAHNWEGDLLVVIHPGGSFTHEVKIYIDLWHGKCRNAYMIAENDARKAALILSGPYENYLRLLKGELEPMSALMTRKLGVQGNMALVMRNIPTVLDFVRCCREVTDSFV